MPKKIFDRTERSKKGLATITFFSMRLAVPVGLDSQEGV